MRATRHYSTRILILGLALLLVVLAGCGKQNQAAPVEKKDIYPLTVTDSFNRQVRIEKAPQRIVSLAPSNTEILFALGLGDKVVGVTSYCDYPVEAKSKEKIGGFSDPSVEKIVALKPDLVVATGMHEKVVKQLDSLKIPVVAINPTRFAEVYGTFELLGQVTGSQKKAGEVIGEMKKKVDEITKKVGNSPKPRVFYEVWDEPLMTAGPGTFINDLIILAGGNNIAADAQKAYPQYSLELLLQRDPEVMIFPSGKNTPEKIMSRPGWQSLAAIKNKRVVAVDPNLVSRPGPRLVQGLELFARGIHPEVFK
ncbi:MAG: cobalamin-binding protein [Firmicutes bacterium]|nr:cobalamin-binding protein [Bacillota bacterium]MCL5039815.1 cobalamin-binding protein [Bacillota bacterium]